MTRSTTRSTITGPIARVRKTAVAIVGLLGQVVALGVLHGTALHWAQLALAAATALGVYHVPNAAQRPPWL